MKNLQGTKWLVTGGTSGLGLAVSKQIILRGGTVAIVSRRESPLLKIAEELGAKAIVGDVGNKEDIYKIAAQAVLHLGRVDYLVNNSSTLGVTPLRSFMDTECETIEKVLQVNLLGPFRLSKAILPGMILRKQGTVINISTDASVSAYENWGAYSVSKAALDHMSHIWSEELKSHGVNFYSIDPGDMDTAMHEEALPGSDRAKLKKPDQAAKELLDFILSSESEKEWERKSL